MSELFAETRDFVQPGTLAFLPAAAPSPLRVEPREGWQVRPGLPWTVVQGPVSTPAQGWKLHVSAYPADAKRVLALAAQVCYRHDTSFKHLANLAVVKATNAKYAPREAAGKFLTIYPADLDTFYAVLEDLEETLSGFAGPYVLSDYPCSTKASIYARYGAFVRREVADADGRMVGAVQTPDGVLVPDLRSVYPATPTWAPRDARIQQMIDDFTASAEQDLPFTVTGSLHFSNAGGVYRGRHHGREVVIKEARAGAGIDGAGNDACVRLRREYDAMCELNTVPGVPEAIGYMTIWRHDYLLMEYVQGVSLIDWFHDNFGRTKTPTDRTATYAVKCLATVDNVRTILTAAHERDRAYGDLNPRNVIIDTEGGVTLIDWEQSDRIDTFSMTFGTPGYVGPDSSDGVQQDNFALYRLALYLLTGRLGPLQMFPDHDCTNLSFIQRLYGMEILTQVLALREAVGSPYDDATRIFCGARPQLPTAESLRRGFIRLTNGELRSPGAPEARPLGVGVEAYQPAGRYALWGGLTGLTAALRATGRPLLEVEHRVFAPTVPPLFRSLGFFDGSSGYAAAALDVSPDADSTIWRSYLATVQSHLHNPDTIPSGPVSLSLFDGLPGALLALTYGAVLTGDSETSETAEQSCRQILDAITFDLLPRSRPGLADGLAGVAVALLIAAMHLEAQEPLDAARACIAVEMTATMVDGPLRARQCRDRSRLLAYPGWGSGGLLVALSLLHDMTGVREFDREQREIARALASPTYSQGGLMLGAAGMLLLAKVAAEDLLPEPQDDLIAYLEDITRTYCAALDGAAYPLGEQNARISFDYSSGGAGILLAACGNRQNPLSWLPLAHASRLWPQGKGSLAGGTSTSKITNH